MPEMSYFLKWFAVSFLFMGCAIYGSGFFTALGDGVWMSIVVAEFMEMTLRAAFLVGKRRS